MTDSELRQPGGDGQARRQGRKPTVHSLGIDLDAQNWQRSGVEPGAVEIAMVHAAGEQWVLTRMGDDPGGPVLVYDRFEWECFLDGAKRGEFDDAAR